MADCEECVRKDAVIEKYRRGQMRRDRMVEQIAALIEDRDRWRQMAQKGSTSANKKINEYRARAISAERSLMNLRDHIDEL